MKPENKDKKEFTVPAKAIVHQEVGGTNIFFESGGEFVLPDYMPKVQKVLRMEAKVLPPRRYMAANEAQMSGNVLHSLIYVGDEGEISATVLPSKYEFSVPYNNEGEIPTAIANVFLESVNCRPSAPRKVNIRTRLRAMPRVFTKNDITSDIADVNGVHKLCGELDSVHTEVLRADNITVSESMEISDSAEARPIWCGANAAVTDVRVSDGGVQVRGDVYVKVMTANGGEAKMHVKKFPFEEFLDGDVSRGALATATAKVLSTEVSREDGGDALVDVVICAEAIVGTPRKVGATFDAFSEISEGRIEYRKTPCTRLVACRTGVYNVGGSLPKSTLQGFTSMLDTTGDVIVDEASANNGRITVSGRCALQSVFATDEGYSSADYSLPFKVSLDCETPDDLDTVVNAALAAVRTRVDGENLVCDMEIALSLHATQCSECDTVKSADFSSTAAYKNNEYPLCLIYPQGESLWALAKKYHISPEKLAQINSIDIDKKNYASADALAEKQVLMLQF